MRYSMPIFSFIGYTLPDLFRKSDNWRQIYKQTTFYTSNVVSRRKKYHYVIKRLRNSCLIVLYLNIVTRNNFLFLVTSYFCYFLWLYFKKIQKQPPEVQKQSPEVSCNKRVLNILQTSQENICVGIFFMKLQAFSLQDF